jgi:hypothetical protein
MATAALGATLELYFLYVTQAKMTTSGLRHLKMSNTSRGLHPCRPDNKRELPASLEVAANTYMSMAVDDSTTLAAAGWCPIYNTTALRYKACTCHCCC